MTHAVSNTTITLQTKYLSIIIKNLMKYNLISVFYYKMMMCYMGLGPYLSKSFRPCLKVVLFCAAVILGGRGGLAGK